MSGRRPWSKQTRNQEPQDNTTKQHYLVYPASQVPFCTPTPGNVWPVEQNMQIELIHCYYHQQQGHILTRGISNKSRRRRRRTTPKTHLKLFSHFSARQWSPGDHLGPHRKSSPRHLLVRPGSLVSSLSPVDLGRRDKKRRKNGEN